MWIHFASNLINLDHCIAVRIGEETRGIIGLFAPKKMWDVDIQKLTGEWIREAYADKKQRDLRYAQLEELIKPIQPVAGIQQTADFHQIQQRRK